MNQRVIKFRVWKDDYFDFINNGWIEDVGLPDIFESLQKSGYFIQQFTGLQDKDGKDIYEGDIIKYQYLDIDSFNYYTATGEVIWNSGMDCYNNLFGGWEVTFGEKTKYINKNCEVIGNIFETPELLDEKTLARNQKPAIKRGRGRPKKEIF